MINDRNHASYVPLHEQIIFSRCAPSSEKKRTKRRFCAKERQKAHLFLLLQPIAASKIENTPEGFIHFRQVRFPDCCFYRSPHDTSPFFGGRQYRVTASKVRRKACFESGSSTSNSARSTIVYKNSRLKKCWPFLRVEEGKSIPLPPWITLGVRSAPLLQTSAGCARSLREQEVPRIPHGP